MGLDDDYLLGLSGSSGRFEKFLVARFSAAVKAARAAGVVFENDDDLDFGSAADVISSVAVAAAADLEAVTVPSHEHQDAVITLIMLSELSILWEEIAAEAPAGLHEPFARALFLTTALARDEAAQYVQAEKLLERALELEEDRARRRAGGLATNSKGAEQKQAALEKARALVASNATLSNEEVAIKLQSWGGMGRTRTVRTLTGWVRAWRREGALQAQR